MAPNTTSKSQDEISSESHVYREVALEKLPSFTKLQSQVMEVVRTSTWWDIHGKDWFNTLVAIAVVPIGHYLLASSNLLAQVLGVFMLGCYHGTLANKCGHLSTHGSMSEFEGFNAFWSRVCIDFIGGFSAKIAGGIHVKIHHPHTNIIGLGDSSTWKVPQVPRYQYMFLLPLTLPILTPLVALHQIIEARDWRELVVFSFLSTSGAAFHLWLLMHFSNFTLVGGLTCLFLYRAVLYIPYIHINIFQHIGLPMYSPESRPARIYQMATGCLNLSSNLLLDVTFGHSLISCHVEHHLFPKLSDAMCLKVKPLVRRYLVENDLPYHEDSYSNRVRVFLRDYDTLMVDAPPITHFVGIQ